MARDRSGKGRALHDCWIWFQEGPKPCSKPGWLAEQDEHWKQGIEVVAMDGFTGFKTAAVEELPQAVEVMDPFPVVKLGSEALDQTRQRVQREVHGRRGRKEDPLYKARRTLTTGLSLATESRRPSSNPRSNSRSMSQCNWSGACISGWLMPTGNRSPR